MSRVRLGLEGSRTFAAGPGATLRENASQAVFARHLNVTTSLVSQWERGEKRPAAPPSSS